MWGGASARGAATLRGTLAPAHGRRRAGLLAAIVLWSVASSGPSHAADVDFLDDASVRDALVGHTLKGKDWIEYYSPSGELSGKVRYYGVHAYTGRWQVSDGKVCYTYGHPQADTCSWLRRRGDRVTHHLRDGTLKKDGDAVRLSGNRLDQF